MSNTSDHRLYNIALTLLPGIGPVLAKNLIAYCGSAERVFKTSKARLEKIPSIGAERAELVAKSDILQAAEEELKFIDDNRIKVLFFTEPDYPQRLKDCTDSPILLYYKGNADLNASRIISIVGTRRATDYGKEMTKKLVADLQGQDILIVSGLAFGIDAYAHSTALDNQLQTVGVLGHGLNTIYPSQNTGIAKRMVEQGGLLTEYKSTDDMSPHNFPMRNRIVAGMCDATIVVESAIEGGAVITANIAHSYNKDVFAIPGKVTDKMSAGCNFLLKSYKATMIEGANDLLEAMGWKEEKATGKPKSTQRTLAINLSDEEQKIYQLLNEKGETEIDTLTIATGLSSGTLASTLLEMEMNSLIVSLPGKRYKLT